MDKYIVAYTKQITIKVEVLATSPEEAEKLVAEKQYGKQYDPLDEEEVSEHVDKISVHVIDHKEEK